MSGVDDEVVSAAGRDFFAASAVSPSGVDDVIVKRSEIQAVLATMRDALRAVPAVATSAALQEWMRCP